MIASKYVGPRRLPSNKSISNPTLKMKQQTNYVLSLLVSPKAWKLFRCTTADFGFIGEIIEYISSYVLVYNVLCRYFSQSGRRYAANTLVPIHAGIFHGAPYIRLAQQVGGQRLVAHMIENRLVDRSGGMLPRAQFACASASVYNSMSFVLYLLLAAGFPLFSFLFLDGWIFLLLRITFSSEQHAPKASVFIYLFFVRSRH